MAAPSTSAYRRLAAATIAVLFISIVAVLLFASHHQPWPEEKKKKNEHTNNNNRRLSESSSSSVTQHEHDLEHVLHLATRTAEDTFTEGGDDSDSSFRVLVIVTTLAEYDKGTRGTTHGADRLKDNVLPILVDGVTSMINRGWSVDRCIPDMWI